MVNLPGGIFSLYLGFIGSIQGRLHQITQETRQVLWEYFVWRVEPTSYVKKMELRIESTGNFKVVALKLVTSLVLFCFFTGFQRKHCGDANVPQVMVLEA